MRFERHIKSVLQVNEHRPMRPFRVLHRRCFLNFFLQKSAPLTSIITCRNLHTFYSSSCGFCNSSTPVSNAKLFSYPVSLSYGRTMLTWCCQILSLFNGTVTETVFQNVTIDLKIWKQKQKKKKKQLQFLGFLLRSFIFYFFFFER